ncbi:MAG: hypothetical protein ACI4P8_04190 [Akkermansia sp.]
MRRYMLPLALSASLAGLAQPLIAAEMPNPLMELAPTAHQLNVIYFVADGVEPVPGYEQRLNELLIYVQQYYGREMARNGYGPRSFGLPMTPEGKVEMVLLRGKRPQTDYAYSGEGAINCLREIDAFFEAHPEKKRSEHTFVIMPTFYNEEYNDESPGGVPFFGFGKNCFALDYAHFDLRYLGEDSLRGRLMTKWFGGFAHELGHGLNLPHNDGTASERAALGTPLMESGNYTFGRSATFLTPASARILDRNQVFAPAGSGIEYYQTQERPDLRDLTVRYTGASLEVSLQIPAGYRANAYIQDPPFVVNQDYDNVAFPMQEVGGPEQGMQRVAVQMPLTELSRLKNVGKGEQCISLLLIAPDGSRFRRELPFAWEGLQPGDALPIAPGEMSSGY